jgi:hypothetical protein
MKCTRSGEAGGNMGAEGTPDVIRLWRYDRQGMVFGAWRPPGWS